MADVPEWVEVSAETKQYPSVDIPGLLGISGRSAAQNQIWDLTAPKHEISPNKPLSNPFFTLQQTNIYVGNVLIQFDYFVWRAVGAASR